MGKRSSVSGEGVQGKNKKVLSTVSSTEDELYIVEQILDRRINNGKLEYLLAWQGYGAEDNTWERADHLVTTCEDLVVAFEAERQNESELKKLNKEKDTAGSSKKASKSAKTTKSSESAKANDKKETEPAASANNSNDEDKHGFDRGLEPEKIMGVTVVNGLLYFMIKFKVTDEIELLPAHLVNIKCPSMVIRYYEERLVWVSNPRDEDVEDEFF